MKAGEKLTKYYPAFLKLYGKTCLVVGGGKVAERKVLSLLRTGAKVVVVSPEITPTLKKLAKQGKITWHQETFNSSHLGDVWLIFACTNHKEVQAEVSSLAEQRKIFCNVVDKPEISSFIVPSTISRGDLQIALSTSGASPAVARRLRERLETLFGEEHGLYLELMRRLRQAILLKDLAPEEKEIKLQRLALAPIDLWLKNRDLNLLRAVLEKEGLGEVMKELEPFFHDKASRDKGKLD